MKKWYKNLPTQKKVAWGVLLTFFLATAPCAWPLYLIVAVCAALVWALIAVIG
jgi:hypothetical protein